MKPSKLIVLLPAPLSPLQQAPSQRHYTVAQSKGTAAAGKLNTCWHIPLPCHHNISHGRLRAHAQVSPIVRKTGGSGFSFDRWVSARQLKSSSCVSDPQITAFAFHMRCNDHTSVFVTVSSVRPCSKSGHLRAGLCKTQPRNISSS